MISNIDHECYVACFYPTGRSKNWKPVYRYNWQVAVATGRYYEYMRSLGLAE